MFKGELAHTASNDRPRLSARQYEVLAWSAQGKTCWETAVLMQCSEATVHYHLKQVFRKLDVVNKTQAVSRAMAEGILGPRS
jgi:LuxR family transcriptional regulator, quorum-sensing system regulator LasR